MENQEQSQTENHPIENISEIQPDHNIAYEVCKKINQKAKDLPTADTSNKLEYTFDAHDSEFDLECPVTTVCMPNKNGGYVVVYQEKEEGFLGDGEIDEVRALKVYLYNEGKLVEHNELLPNPSAEEYAKCDGLFFSNNKIENFKPKYELVGNILTVANEQEESPMMGYDWNGEKFVPSKTYQDLTMYNIVTTNGLGSIKLGDKVPQSLAGYEQTKSNNKVTFNRFGKKAFQLSLNADNQIDTITVLTNLFTYSMCGIGGCNWYGIGFNPVDDVFDCHYNVEKDYFVFDGDVWIRRIEKEGGIIDFYTTKDAVKNIYPEKGKTINQNSNPQFDPNAKVTLIKIYKSKGYCQDCNNLSNEEKTKQIRSMYSNIANDKNLTKKSIEIEDEESGYPCDYDYYYKDENLVMVQFSTGDGVMTDIKIYLQNCCPFFCLSVSTYPNDTEETERIYICNNKIFKYLDNDKKELDVNSEEVATVMTQINSILKVAKENESKAK